MVEHLLQPSLPWIPHANRAVVGSREQVSAIGTRRERRYFSLVSDECHEQHAAWCIERRMQWPEPGGVQSLRDSITQIDDVRLIALEQSSEQLGIELTWIRRDARRRKP